MGAVGNGIPLGELLGVLERRYPESSAQEWDAVGLVCGDPTRPVRSVLLAVDPVADVVDEAVELGVDLLLVHHPLLLRPVRSVRADDPKGAVVHRLVRAGIALHVLHTNADAARPGVSDALARVIGLDHLAPLAAAPSDPVDKHVVYVPEPDAERVVDAMAAAGAGEIGEYARCAFTAPGTQTFTPGPRASPAVGTVGERHTGPEARVEMVAPRRLRERVLSAVRAVHPYEEPAIDVLELAPWSSPRGLGRVGTLDTTVTVDQLAGVVAAALPFTHHGVRVAGDPSALVRRVAVCGGSGDSLLDAVRASGADAYVTADLRHHPVSELRERARGGPPHLLDVSHWASEWPWLQAAGDRLRADLEGVGTVEVNISRRRSDPWSLRVASPGGPVR
ncbi:Nif3-like dinuclear metal center hexameric protein [Pseudokineococcus sp. 1T1Z-3]|uniref:Nif3-like dinuclear metal center hexameric protein n=1 Tax=Pseudokineococcus sp. 1T1Z-3 TaxID=3132745 RepID=UPI0030B72304